MHRRRFLTIAASATCAATLPARKVGALTQWRGVAMGAAATITLEHPEADRIIARARAEIDRLEAVFSLHRPGSALSRLNAAGHLYAPPFDLLDCLSLAGRVHATTGGAFDPTIQPLWALHAETAVATGGLPDDAARAAAQARTGWHKVSIDAGAIHLPAGGALSLNGIAQGFVADRVAALFRAEGLSDVLIDTGEMRALGGNPRGGPWEVQLQAGGALLAGLVGLRDGALATSAPLGTVLDGAGRIGHILDPMTGRPADRRWRLVSVTGPSAALADGLSTAFVLMDRPRIDAALLAWPGVRIARLVPGDAAG